MLVIRVSVMGGQALGEALLRLEVGGAVHRLLDVPHEVPQCEVVAEAHHRPLLARLVSRLPLVVREDVEVRERRQKHLDANQKILRGGRRLVIDNTEVSDEPEYEALPEGHEDDPLDAEEFGPGVHPGDLLVHGVVEADEAVKGQRNARVAEHHHVELGAPRVRGSILECLARVVIDPRGLDHVGHERHQRLEEHELHEAKPALTEGRSGKLSNAVSP
mmetsp:Transcript_30097/g.67480  ORF Transcript_30097/g.67480 Transcript_30097/m.67480 type:complete len:218 (-) Transcript_30097:2103-2756(-)